MTMSDRSGRNLIASSARTRWKRRLTGLALLVAGAAAVIPAQGALAAGNGPQPPSTRVDAAIKAAYLQAFTGGQNQAHNLAAVEDGPALASTLALAEQNFPAATSPSQVTVSGIKIKGPAKAALRFDVVYQGGYDIGQRDGTAVVVDRQWKVSRDTFCSVLSLAGAVCPPKAGRPPRDPAAARLAIQQAYTRAFTGGEDPAYSLGAVEDGPALAGTLAQAMQNFPGATSTAAVTTGDIVFTSPRSAALPFHITYQQGADFGVQNGTAVIVGGQWKVSRQTYCTVMGWAGATCPAP
ncbi:hypothetical protein FraEuI1c_0452 [Pseudofrankia inefficax]|uniref:Low molecular weight antigen MTB12-like C-terminal domain-containing protein n=1 Tax=Pseudofrankia inefficax (strain DSM 45817 / CECT 9037 / DDB 130130 / EuI1c) TaxID=298654 RepID=E3J9X3_PSEI1|nr:hypothetical protein FraEuI1c_0452 [Pseudofrankia inefficax]